MKKIFGILIFLLGLVVIIYPAVSNYREDQKQDALIKSFEEAMVQLSEQNNKPLERIVVTTILNDDKEVVSLENIRPVETVEVVESDDERDESNTSEEVDPSILQVPNSIEQVEEEEIVYTREQRNSYITSAWPVEAILSIEKIDLVMPIIEGTRAEYLDVSPCSVLGASKPWESGNYSVAGHRSLTYGRHFNRLNELDIDDTIVVTDLNDQTYTYRVYKTSIVHETDTSVLKNSDYDEITLITCDPIGEKNPEYRLIIKAKKN